MARRGTSFLEAIQFDGDLKEDGNEDKLAPKIEAIKDCAILYVAAIGGSGAARVVANNIHPMKVNQPEEIADLLGKLRGCAEGHAAALAAQGPDQGQGTRTSISKNEDEPWPKPDAAVLEPTPRARRRRSSRN